jgi:hypothetical protein
LSVVGREAKREQMGDFGVATTLYGAVGTGGAVNRAFRQVDLLTK